MEFIDLTRADLIQLVRSYESRLSHLLSSETVRLFDEVDPKTKEYKRDIKRLDTYGVHYKIKEFERTNVKRMDPPPEVPREPLSVLRDMRQKIMEIVPNLAEQYSAWEKAHPPLRLYIKVEKGRPRFRRRKWNR